MSQNTTKFFKRLFFKFKITQSKKNFFCVLTHIKPSPYCITKHNGDDASKEILLVFLSPSDESRNIVVLLNHKHVLSHHFQLVFFINHPITDFVLLTT